MYRELDEQSLARLCSENDRRAQEELYTRYAGKLFTLCLRYSDNRDEARDLMHDSILMALSRIDTFSYRGEGSLYAWIRRIAINMALADIRRNKFRFIHLPDTGPEEISEPSEEDFANALIECPNIRQALLKLGLAAKGANYGRAKTIMKKYNIQK